MYKSVYFKKQFTLNIIYDLTENVLKDIHEVIKSKHIKTTKNEFFLSDFEGYLNFENMSPKSKMELFRNNFGFQFITIIIDNERHKVDKKYSMKNDLFQNYKETLKSIKIDMVAYTKKYDIEDLNDMEIKLKDYDDLIKLNDLNYLKPTFK